MKHLMRIIGIAFALTAAPSFAQHDYPVKPIRLIVGNAPGGASDVGARVFADEMSKFLKQPVIVDNRPGAGSLIGALAVKNAPPDGYVLYAGSTLNFTSTFIKDNYMDAAKELQPISLLAQGDLFVFARGDLGVSSIREFAGKAKTTTVRHSAASPSMYLIASQVAKSAGFQFDNIPYRSTDQALMGLLGAQGDFMVNSLPGMSVHLQSGKLKVIAIAGAHRSAQFPNVPTLKEQGVNIDLDFFLGLWAPLNTPRDVVAKIAAAVAEASKAPAVIAKINGLAMTPKPSTPEELLRAHVSGAKAYADGAAITGYRPD